MNEEFQARLVSERERAALEYELRLAADAAGARQEHQEVARRTAEAHEDEIRKIRYSTFDQQAAVAKDFDARLVAEREHATRKLEASLETAREETAKAVQQAREEAADKCQQAV